MRAVFIGASSLTVMTAGILARRGHEIIIIDYDKSVIDDLMGQMDCGYIHGDGTIPAILKETRPEETDVLFCLTGNDQTNIIASLVGRSLGFKRQVTKIINTQFEHICIELGLKDLIIPSRTIGRYLADMFEGQDMQELSAMIKNEAHVYSFVARSEDEVKLDELKLPAKSRIICLYRDDKLLLPDGETKLGQGDEVFIITDRRHLAELQERWG